MLDSLSGTEQIDFHLFFAQIQNRCNLFIAFAFYFSQLDDVLLGLRQFLQQFLEKSEPFTSRQAVVWSGSIGAAMQAFVQDDMLRFFFFASVQGKVPANGQAISFDRVQLRPFVAFVPHPYQCFLNDVFRFCRVECDTKSQPIEFVFQGQYIVPKTDFFHLSGIYGTKTKSAIKSFQRNNGLTVDGIAGEMTWRYIDIRVDTYSETHGKVPF